MTKAYSQTGDNNGLCEVCSDKSTLYQSQRTIPVLLGGGMGWGTIPSVILTENELFFYTCLILVGSVALTWLIALLLRWTER